VEPPEGIPGLDLSPIVFDGQLEEERTEVLFTFDDVRVEANKPSAVNAADRIRCVRQKDWKYARYFHADSSYKEEYEMYDLTNDPNETTNLAYDYSNPAIIAKREELKNLLAQLEETELPRSPGLLGSE